MTAPLILRLEHALSQAADACDRAEIFAEIACYEARIGAFEAAEKKRTELRREFGDGRSPKVSIRLMCLDALLLYFRELSPEARDRLARAKLISVACKETRLIALSAAWLAHIDFNQARFESMASAIAESLAAMAADDGSAELRVALVLGDAFLFSGHEATSKLWYEHARRLASKLGDQAAFGAITYNRAALHVSVARFGSAQRDLSESELRLICGEVDSAINYQTGAGLSSLDHLLRTAQIGAMVLSGRYSEALEKCEQVLGSNEVPSDSAELAQVHADRALCQAKLGLIAARHGDPQLTWARDSFAADDLAILLNTELTIARVLNLDLPEDPRKKQLGVAIRLHQQTLARLGGLLEPFAMGPSSL